MKAPILPEDPRRRAAALSTARAALLTVVVVGLFGAVVTGGLIYFQELYRQADPLVEQRWDAERGEWVDKPLIAEREEVLALHADLQAWKGEEPDRQERSDAHAAWQRQMDAKRTALAEAQTAYRQHDKEWTQRYFELAWRFKVGAWFLAGALVVFVLTLELGRMAKPELELPRGKHPMSRALADARLARILVAVLTLALLGLIALVAVYGPTRIPAVPGTGQPGGEAS